MKYDAVVVASGQSTRSELGFNKVLFVMKNKKTVLENACQVFIDDEDCQHVIIVTKEQDIKINNNKIIFVSGGEKRSDSVINGLAKVSSDYVFIHDGARPFITKEDIDKLKKELETCEGAILVSESINTLKEVKDGFVTNTLKRSEIYNAFTPQAFKTKLIIEAYNKGDLEGATDDSFVFEKMGYKVKAIIGNKNNIKLTYREDFENI